MNYVIDIDKLSNGVDYWRNPDYKPQGFNAQCGFFKKLKQMQRQGKQVCAFSKSAEKNMPEISRWFKLNGVNIPIVYKQDDDMTPIWNDKTIEIDPSTGEFIITQPMADNHIKKTTYAPIQVEVTNMESKQCFSDDATNAQAFSTTSYADMALRQDTQSLSRAGEDLTLLKALRTKITNELQNKKGALRIINGKEYKIEEYPDLNSETADIIHKISQKISKIEQVKTANDALWDNYDRVVAEINKAPVADQVQDNIRKLGADLVYKAPVPADKRFYFDEIITDLNKTRNNVRRRVQLVNELNRLKKLRPKVQARKESALMNTISDAITNMTHQLNANSNAISDDDILKYQSIILPEQTAEEKAKEALTIKGISLNDDVKKFAELSPLQKLINIVNRTVRADVLNKEGSTRASLVEALKIPNAQVRKLLLDATKEDDITRAMRLNDLFKDKVVTPKQFNLIAKDYDANGIEKAKENLDKITQNDTATATLAQGLSGVKNERAQTTAQKIIDKNIKKINDLNADILRHQQMIENAKPEELAKAESYIRDKQRTYDRLKLQIAKMKKDGRTNTPQYLATVRDLDKMHRATPFTALEKAILLRKRKLKELARVKKHNSAKAIATQIKNDNVIAQAEDRAGILSKDEKIALINDLYGIDGDIAKEIASMYSAQQINNGIPLINDKQYYTLAVAKKNPDDIAGIMAKGEMGREAEVADTSGGIPTDSDAVTDIKQVIIDADIPQYDKDRLLSQVKDDTTMDKTKSVLASIKAREQYLNDNLAPLKASAVQISATLPEPKPVTMQDAKRAVAQAYKVIALKLRDKIKNDASLTPNLISAIIKQAQNGNIASAVDLYNSGLSVDDTPDTEKDNTIAFQERRQQLEQTVNPIERTALLSAFDKAVKEKKSLEEIEQILKETRRQLGDLTN